MTGIAVPNAYAPRILDRPGPRTCATCKNWAVLKEMPQRPICVAEPPRNFIITVPETDAGGNIVKMTQTVQTGYPEAKPHWSCGQHKPAIEIAQALPTARG